MKKLATKGEPVANFIARASGSGHAFVENECVRNESAEFRIATDLAFERTKPTCSFTLLARQSDVRMVGTSLGDEAAKAGRRGDALLQCLKFGGEVDTRKENS